MSYKKVEYKENKLDKEIHEVLFSLNKEITRIISFAQTQTDFKTDYSFLVKLSMAYAKDLIYLKIYSPNSDIQKMFGLNFQDKYFISHKNDILNLWKNGANHPFQLPSLIIEMNRKKMNKIHLNMLYFWCKDMVLLTPKLNSLIESTILEINAFPKKETKYKIL